VSAFWLLACRGGAEPVDEGAALLLVRDGYSSAGIDSLSLALGDTAWLEAVGLDAVGRPIDGFVATWQSSLPSVADVDADGRVVGLGVGTSQIFVASGTLAHEVTIRVVEAAAPSGAPEFLFWSDWSTATGGGSDALRDTGKARPWTFTQGSGAFEVRSTSLDGRDYPTTSYLRVSNAFAQLAFQSSDGYVPTPRVGESIFLRMYYRVTITGTSGDTHGTYFDDHPSTGTNWGPQALGIYLIPSASTSMTFLVSAGAGQDPRYFSPGVSLSKDVTYRIELRYTRTGTHSYTLGARIYDAAGSLLHGEGAFRDDYWYTGAPRLDGRFFRERDGAASSLTGLMIGLEAAQGGPSPFFGEYAGLAVCRGNWCGPYLAGQ